MSYALSRALLFRRSPRVEKYADDGAKIFLQLVVRF